MEQMNDEANCNASDDKSIGINEYIPTNQMPRIKTHKEIRHGSAGVYPEVIQYSFDASFGSDKHVAKSKKKRQKSQADPSDNPLNGLILL